MRQRLRGAAVVVAVVVVVTGGAAAIAEAHNGLGIAPIYADPFGVVVTDGESPVILRWTTSELHPESDYRI